MTTFALVHGAWHGAWCWERLAPLLRDHGHRVVAMDLPSDDRSATVDTYADVVCGELNGHADVVLVGHSLAGLTIPLVAARLPVRHLVYVCALIPDIGRSFFEQMRGDTAMLNPIIRWDWARPKKIAVPGWTTRPLGDICSATATRRRPRRPSPNFGLRRFCPTACPTRWMRIPLSLPPMCCAPTTSLSIRSGLDASRANGLVPSSPNCPAVILRSFRDRRPLPTCCSAPSGPQRADRRQPISRTHIGGRRAHSRCDRVRRRIISVPNRGRSTNHRHVALPIVSGEPGVADVPIPTTYGIFFGSSGHH